MINEIITLLTNTSSVTDQVPAANIFPLFRLQGSTLPAIVIQLLDTDPVYTKDQVSDLDLHTFEITVFGEGPKFVWRTATLVRQRLDTWTGDTTGIDKVRMIAQATDVFEVVDAHSVTQRYECHMKR